MSDSKLESLAALVQRILIDRQNRLAHIQRFQEVIWKSDEQLGGEVVDEVLRDLAFDLDYYEPEPTQREEDESYYGDERLEDEVSTALLQLQRAGIRPESG